MANHTHNGSQIVTASSLPDKKKVWLREHTHTTAQVTGTPSTALGRAQGKQHWHDTSKVS